MTDIQNNASTLDREEVIRLARECGDWNGQTCEMNDVGLERFAALVAAAEREACEKLAEQLYVDARSDEITDAIRARGGK